MAYIDNPGAVLQLCMEAPPVVRDYSKLPTSERSTRAFTAQFNAANRSGKFSPPIADMYEFCAMFNVASIVYKRYLAEAQEAVWRYYEDRPRSYYHDRAGEAMAYQIERGDTYQGLIDEFVLRGIDCRAVYNAVYTYLHNGWLLGELDRLARMITSRGYEVPDMLHESGDDAPQEDNDG